MKAVACGIAAVLLLLSLPERRAAAAGPAVVVEPDRLIPLLRDGDFRARQRTLDALAANPSAVEKYGPVVRQALKDRDRAVRQQAAVALAAFGLADRAILEELVRGMGERYPARYHAHPEDARSAMQALVKLGAKAVPALVAALEDEKFAGRYLAIEAVGSIGPAAREALPTLAKALRDREDPFFPALVGAKWRIDQDTDYALQELIPLLETRGGRGCGGAIDVLVAMGPDAKGAVPAIVQALKRYKETHLVWALRELARHAKAPALAALWEALAERRLVGEAAIALQGLGVPAKEVVPHLLRRLDRCKEDGTDPYRLVYAIVLFGPQATAYAPDLIRNLKHPNPAVRSAAAWGVCRVGADNAVVEAALAEALKDKHASEEAARSLQLLRGTK
jgi:HEAT repeat protein